MSLSQKALAWGARGGVWRTLPADVARPLIRQCQAVEKRSTVAALEAKGVGPEDTGAKYLLDSGSVSGLD